MPAYAVRCDGERPALLSYGVSTRPDLRDELGVFLRKLRRSGTRTIFVDGDRAFRQNPTGGIQETLGPDRLREQITIAFGDDRDSPVTIRLAQIALATIDGTFVASRADSVTLEDLLEPLAPALVAVRRALLAMAR